MTTPHPVIILKREEGPAFGLTTVTVDAPELAQAQFTISSAIVGTPEELRVLAHMLSARLADNDVLKEHPL